MSWLHRGLYGLAERLTGRAVTPLLQELRRNETLTRPQLEQLQWQRLQTMMQYARDRIPYYRRLPSIDSLQELSRLPLLSKQEILRDPEQFWPQGPERRHLRRSGGSTGERLPVFYDDEGLDRTAAMQLRMMEWCGRRPGEREVHFASTTLQRMTRRDQAREALKTLALNRQNIFVDLFDDSRYDAILKTLSTSRTKVVQGYPSIAFQLACFAERTGRNCRGLFPALEVEGETLHEFQRQKIEQIFGCEVFNRYGNAEFGIVAHECRCHDGLHVRSDLALVETIPLESQPDGEAAGAQEIVITGLTNRGMPLFRYRTGDLGVLDTDPCACGLSFPRLRQLSGRVHELITLPGLGQVATYVILNSLERLAWLRNFQIAQTNRGIRLYLLLAPGGTLEALREVQSTIWHSHRMGQYRLDFEVVRQLTVSPRGKFRYVIDEPGLSPGRRVLVETEMGEIADAAGWMEA